MITIILFIVQVITLVLVIRLNKCGRIVNVHQEYSYIPAPRKKRSVSSSRDDEYDD